MDCVLQNTYLYTCLCVPRHCICTFLSVLTAETLYLYTCLYMWRRSSCVLVSVHQSRRCIYSGCVLMCAKTLYLFTCLVCAKTQYLFFTCLCVLRRSICVLIFVHQDIVSILYTRLCVSRCQYLCAVLLTSLESILFMKFYWTVNVGRCSCRTWFRHSADLAV